MENRTEKPTEKRNRILRTALLLFSTQGYHATGINDILKQCGIPKGSFYNFFPEGKEQLALEALETSIDFRETSIRELLAPFQDPVDAFQARIDSVMERVTPPYNLEQPSPYFMMAHELSAVNDTLRDSCIRAYEVRKNIYRDKLLELGYETEAAEKTAATFQMMLNGATEMSVIRKDIGYLELLREQVPMLVLMYKKVG